MYSAERNEDVMWEPLEKFPKWKNSVFGFDLKRYLSTLCEKIFKREKSVNGDGEAFCSTSWEVMLH